MADVFIEIKDDETQLEWYIPLNNRITLLRGDSGIGKTKNGKSSICEDTLTVIEDNSDRKILVLADMAGFGCHISQFYNDIMRSFPNVVIDKKYESFEYVLLNTNYFKDNNEVRLCLTGKDNDAVNYYSKESYYEKVLERVTKGTRLKYVHGNAKFRECWYVGCNSLENDLCNEHIKEMCEYYIDTPDKHEYLLKDTKFDYFLTLLPRPRI